MKINQIIKEDANAFMTKVGRGISNALKKSVGDEPVDYKQDDKTRKRGDYNLHTNPDMQSDVGVDQLKNWPTRFQHHQIGTDWSDTNITKQGAWKLDDLSNQAADSFGVDRQIFKKMRDYPDDIPKDNKFHSDPERRAERQRQYDAYFHMHPDMVDGYNFNADNPYIQDYKKRKQWADQPQRESTNEDGVIVPGVNTTVDVKPGETERQAAKFFGHNKPIKQKKYKSDTHTLYNMGLAEGKKPSPKGIKQSDVFRVLNNVAARRDSSGFPVKFYDGSIIKVEPQTARKFLNFYDEIDDAKRSLVNNYLRTKNGFRELLQRKFAESLENDWHSLLEGNTVKY